MRPTNRTLLALAIGTFCVCTNADAQLSWDSPLMVAPATPPGLSLLFIDYGLDPNPGVGGLVVWRPEAGGLGFRASAARGLGNKLNYAGGIDVGGPLLPATPQFPLTVNWISGIGGSYGDYSQLALPLAVAAGRPVASERLWLHPYAALRAVVEARFGSTAPSKTMGLALGIDVGADLALGRARAVMLRSALSLGDRPAAVVGLHLGRPPRAASAQQAIPAPRQ